jgi:hypothetical protein
MERHRAMKVKGLCQQASGLRFQPLVVSTKMLTLFREAEGMARLGL